MPGIVGLFSTLLFAIGVLVMAAGFHWSGGSGGVPGHVEEHEMHESEVR